LVSAINIMDGKITCKAVAEPHGFMQESVQF